MRAKLFLSLSLALSLSWSVCRAQTNAADSAENPFENGPQSLSQSIGNPQFVTLPNSSRTKPNFLDMAADKGLQMLFSSMKPKGIDVSYEFLEIIGLEKKVVLRNMTVSLSLPKVKGTFKAGLVKMGLQDVFKIIKQAILTFSEVTLNDVKLDVVSGEGARAETVTGSLDTLSVDYWKLYACTAIDEELGTNPEKPLEYDERGFVSSPYGYCMNTNRIYGKTGALTVTRPTEKTNKKGKPISDIRKYALNEGLLNSFKVIFFGKPQIFFSIGKINDVTVRTPEEIKAALEK